MDLEIIQNKKILTGIALIILIIIFLFVGSTINFEQTNTITQTIKYSDIDITKSISLGNERIETYDFQVTNPVIGYLIVPKTIASSVSELSISGDFKTEVIKEDPILKIESKDYAPGVKKLVIKSGVGEENHTTILLLVPLSEYNLFSDSQKTQLNEIVKGFSDIDSNYYTPTETKQIMEEFSNSIQPASLKKKAKDNTIIYFSESNAQTYLTIAQQLIDKRKTTPTQIVSPQTIQNESSFDSLLNKLENILGKRQNIELTNNGDNNFNILIKFKPEAKEFILPKEIILPYSITRPIVIWNGIVEFNEDIRIDENITPKIESNKNITVEFLRLNEENIKNLSTEEIVDLSQLNGKNEDKSQIYLMSIIVDVSNYTEPITEEEIRLKFSTILSKTYKTKLYLIENPCNENINYYDVLTTEEVQNKKNKELTSAASCVGTELKNAFIEEMKDINIEMPPIQELNEHLLIGAMEQDSESIKKLEETLNQRNDQFKEEYLKANGKLQVEIKGLKSLINTSMNRLLVFRNSLIDKNSINLTEEYIIDLNILYQEMDLFLDPTDMEAREKIIQLQVDHIKQRDINEETLKEYEKRLKENYSKKYGTSWNRAVISDISGMHYLAEHELNEMEKMLALMILSSRPFSSSGVTNKSCPTILNIEQGIYNPGNTYIYNSQHYKDFRDVIKYLAFNTFYSMSSGSQEVIGGDRELTEIEKKLKNFQDSTNCKLNLNNFEDPQQAWYDAFKSNPDSTIEDFSERRDSLRKRIQTRVKEKVGLELIGNSIYDSYKFEKDGEKLIESTTNFNSPYEKLSINKTKATLLEMYEINDENLLAEWLEIKDYDPRIGYSKITNLKESLAAPFNNQLKSTIRSISHTKFKSFISNMTVGEKLEAELAFVDNVLNTQYILITKKMKESEDQGKVNYILYNLFTGNFNERPNAEISLLLDTTKGLRKIKDKLLEGKSFIQIYNESAESIFSKGLQIEPPQYLIYETTPIDDMYGTGMVVDVSSFNKKINPAFIEWKKSIFSVGESAEIILAFENPLMKAELTKEDLITKNIGINKSKIENATTKEEKERLVLSKSQEASILISIADYYYDVGLYDQALQNYDYIKSRLKGTDESVKAEKRIGELGGSWRLFFGKPYWETFGSISKEFTSLKSIGTYLAFYGFIKFIAAPELAALKLRKTTAALKQDLFLKQAGSKGAMVTAQQAHELASLNVMKNGVKGYDIINGKLVLLQTAEKTTQITTPLIIEHSSKAQKAWLVTKKFFGTIRNSKIWKGLNKDLLVNEKWYQNYVETKISSKLAYEFSNYTPNEIVQNIVDLAGKRRVASAIESAQYARQMGLITTRQAQFISQEIKVLTALDITDEVQFLNNTGSSLQLAHAEQQLITLSSVQQAQIVLVNPSAVSFRLNNIIQFSKMGGVIEGERKLIETERKLIQIRERVQVLEGYISQHSESVTTSLLGSWQDELAELKTMDNSISAFTQYSGEPIAIACSVCHFEIGLEGSEIGTLSYIPRPKRTQDLVAVNTNVLNLSTITVGGEVATQVVVENVILEGMNRAIISLDKIAKGTVKISVLSSTPFTVNAGEIPIIYSAQTNIGYSFGTDDPITKLVKSKYGFSLDELKSIPAYSVEYGIEQETFVTWGDNRDSQAKFFEGLAINQTEHGMLEIRPPESAGEVQIGTKTTSFSNPVTIGRNNLPMTAEVNGKKLIISNTPVDSATQLDYDDIPNGTELKPIIQDPTQRTVYIGSGGYWRRIQEANNWPTGVGAFFSRATGVTFIGPNLLASSVHHEHTHRALQYMSTKDKAIAIGALQNNPNWKTMTDTLVRIHPKYAGEDPNDLAEELLAFYRERVAYPELFGKIQTEELIKFLDDYVAPLYTPEVATTFARGEENFFAMVKSGKIGTEPTVFSQQENIKLSRVKTVTMEECSAGCSIEGYGTIVHDETLAESGKIANATSTGSAVNMSRVESIQVMQTIPSLELQKIVSNIPQADPVGNRVSEDMLAWINEGDEYGSKAIRQMYVDKINVVSADQFETALSETVSKFNLANSAGEPYAVIFDEEAGKSKRWVFEKIRSQLTTKPTAGFYSHDSSKAKSLLINEGVNHFVIFDDAMYSGQQVLNTSLGLTSNLGETPIKLTIVTPFSTTEAISSITAALSERNVELNIIQSQTINTLAQSLTESEKAMLVGNSDPGLTNFRGFHTTTVLPHKNPDYMSFPQKMGDRLAPVAEPYKADTPYLFEEEGQFTMMARKIHSVGDPSIEPTRISFTCQSPCVFENGTPIEVIEDLFDIDIYGDFSQIEKSNVIAYSHNLVKQEGLANALGGAPNLLTTHVSTLESAMMAGKTIATIQPLNTGKQALIIYRPEELAPLKIDSTGELRSLIQKEVMEINESLARLSFESSDDLMKTKDVAVKSYLDFIQKSNPSKAEEIMILREASDFSKVQRNAAVKSLMFESEADLFYSPITGDLVTVGEYLQHYYQDIGLGNFSFEFNQRNLSLAEIKQLNKAMMHRNNRFLVDQEQAFVTKAITLFDDYATAILTGDTQKANFAKNQLSGVQSELFALNQEGYLTEITPLFINRYQILIDELTTQSSVFLSITAPNGNTSKTLVTFTDITHDSLIDGEFLPIENLGFMDSTVSVVFGNNFTLGDGTKTSANLLTANKTLIHEVDHIVQHLVGTNDEIMEGLAVFAEDRLALIQDGFFIEDEYGSMYYFEHTLYKAGRIFENNEYGQGYYAVKKLEKAGEDISKIYDPNYAPPNLAKVEAELGIWANNLSPNIIPKSVNTLTIKCNSPCNWTSTQSPVKIFNPSEKVSINGDFDKEFIKEIRPIQTYNPATVTVNKINRNGLSQTQINQIFGAMQQGKTVAVISSHYSGGQEVTVYHPEGTSDLVINVKEIYPPQIFEQNSFAQGEFETNIKQLNIQEGDVITLEAQRSGLCEVGIRILPNGQSGMCSGVYKGITDGKIEFLKNGKTHFINPKDITGLTKITSDSLIEINSNLSVAQQKLIELKRRIKIDPSTSFPIDFDLARDFPITTIDYFIYKDQKLFTESVSFFEQEIRFTFSENKVGLYNKLKDVEEGLQIIRAKGFGKFKLNYTELTEKELAARVLYVEGRGSNPDKLIEFAHQIAATKTEAEIAPILEEDVIDSIWRNNVENSNSPPPYTKLDYVRDAKNEFFMHFTDAQGGESIPDEGFKYGITQINGIQQTRGLGAAQTSEKGAGYAFAAIPGTQMYYPFSGNPSDRAIIFKGDAILAFQRDDVELQAIFWNESIQTKNMVPLYKYDNPQHPNSSGWYISFPNQHDLQISWLSDGPQETINNAAAWVQNHWTDLQEIRSMNQGKWIENNLNQEQSEALFAKIDNWADEIALRRQ
ncbi:MAG: hypothetical protein HON47_03410 [Candidatus Diapherotrites archaeon]|jgi:hypothetical protein|uniref:PRTase-CE domain-containing protein n=1 Tax=Candidatus Iainarchaeum sp. TaxID=3101447 RepID=A0A8T5GF52_9ARCH|nr:hypothetical protein [Candidatus Diapherotrites archaeon]